MSLTFQHVDSVTFSNKVSTNFACSVSSDGRILLITENNVLIYTLMNYIDNIFSDIAFKKKAASVPEFSFSTELGINFENFYDKVSKDDLFEKVLRLDLTSKLEHSTAVDLKPIAAAWSPKGLLGKSHCVLSVLSNFYGLSIIVKDVDEAGVEQYKCVCNVTKCIVENKKWYNISHVNTEIQMEEWTMRAANTCPIAFVWSHLIENSHEAYAVLFVAHPDGSVSSWKFNKRNEHDSLPSPLTFVGMTNTSLGNISTMYWSHRCKNGGALCYGNNGGKLAVINVSNLTTETVSFKNEVIFWDENDQKRVDRIISIDYDNHTYLIAVKEEYLMIFAINQEGLVLDEVLFDMGNLAITGLVHYTENILLVLTAGRLKKLALSIIDSCIHIKEEVVALKLDSTKFKTYGMILSENKVFIGILAYPCRLKDITRIQTPTNFIIYHDTSISPLQTIMANKDGSLEKYWDCFEILRLTSYKEKKFPWQGLDPTINYDKLTLTQLKSLRWVSKLSEKVYDVVPSINEYKIKPYILLHYLATIIMVVNRMKKLLSKLSHGEEISTFQLRSLDVQNMFLKEMVVMKILEKAEVGERFIDEITSVMEVANEIEYPDMPPCFWCGEKIIGPTCIPVHADSRCAISMMQIFLMPGFKCPFCKCVAHPEIAKEMDLVTCPYCDIPMDQVYSHKKVEYILNESNEKVRKKLRFALKDNIPEQPFVICPDDCLKEDSPEDISQGEADYLALTDSEDEESLVEKMNFLRNKFFEAMGTNTSQPSATQGSSNEDPDYIVPIIEIPPGDNDGSDYSFDEDSDGEKKRTPSKKS